MVGARRDEHIALPAEQFDDRGVVHTVLGDQVRQRGRRVGGVLIGEDDGRLGFAEQSAGPSSMIASTASCWAGVVALR